MDKPGVRWRESIELAQQVLNWAEIKDLVAYVTPTAFGQDLFIFYHRDEAIRSFKPREPGPSFLCLESMRRVCSGLSNRMADSAYARQQVLVQQIFGHTVRTPIETATVGFRNIVRQFDLPMDGSVKGVKGAIAEIKEQMQLSLNIADPSATQDAVTKESVDLLDEIRRYARQYEQRYGNHWEPSFSGEVSTWPINMTRNRLQLLLSNAIGNAFKYSFRDRPVTIRVGYDIGQDNRPVNSTVVTIENEGYGVLPEEIPSLHVRQFRGRAGLHKSGNGLGLFLISWILAQEGKAWKFESEPVHEIVSSPEGKNYKNRLTFRLPGRITE